MGQEPTGSFHCHPKCLEWSYWRRMALDLREEISGLRPGQMIELILAVDDAENEAVANSALEAKELWWADRPNSRIGRDAVVQLSLRGFTDVEIERAFGFPHGATVRVLADKRIHPKARDIVAAHLEGDPPSRISRDYNVGIPTVYDILESIGEEPNRLRDLKKSGSINDSIVKLYEDMVRRGDKNIHRQIANRLGIDEQKVKARIQYQRRKGRISEKPPQGGRQGGRRAAQ